MKGAGPAAFAVLLLFGIGGATLGEPFVTTLATKAAIFALAGAGLNIALGQGGLVSFGHAAFFGLGGYACGILASHAAAATPAFGLVPGTKAMPLLWFAAMALGGLAALVIGALSLRTRGVHFIMITLAFAQMLFYFAISWPAYGGEDGLSFYTRNAFFGLNTFDPLIFFAIVAGLLALALTASAVLARSAFGLALAGARQSEARAVAVGLNPYGLRLLAFALSGSITGLAGALYADLNRFVSPQMLSWQMSGEIMIFVILGGVGRLFGPVAGAGLYILLEHLLGGITERWQLVLGLLLLAVVLHARGGVLGLLAGRRHG